MGTGTYKVSVLENISGTSYKYIISKTVTVSGTSTSAYLISTSEINFYSSMAPIKLAASLTSGKTTDSQKVQAIYNWVVNNIDYDRGKNPAAGYVPSIVNTYNTRKGICYDFAALFAAMLRSQGVPAKLVKGYADNVSGYHAWNEVYINGKWYTIDTSYDAQVSGSMFKYSGYHKTSES
jgi:transglutaminase-like putative cysteine protease